MVDRIYMVIKFFTIAMTATDSKETQKECVRPMENGVELHRFVWVMIKIDTCRLEIYHGNATL